MKKIKKIFVAIVPAIMLFVAGLIAFSSLPFAEQAGAYSGEGGLLYVGSNSTFNISSGLLSSAGATSGGAVYIGSGGKLNLSGGTISGNTATNGGGVFVGSGGNFNLIGGMISENSAQDGGGVYVAQGGNFSMSGGTISRNFVVSGGRQIYNAGTFTMTGGELRADAIRVDKNGNVSSSGEYVLFGSYPQTIKANNVTIDETVTDLNGYYTGSDGHKYAKVVAKTDSYGNNSRYSFSNGSSISTGTAYFFKVEPIKWRILSKDGEKYTLFCENLIDQCSWSSSRTLNYKTSTIREFLNGSFLRNAFSESERLNILNSTVDNSVSTVDAGGSGSSYVCENTQDKVWVPSHADIKNDGNFGFTNADRIKNATDFAKANGLFVDKSLTDYTMYWTRSPYGTTDTSVYASYVVDGCGHGGVEANLGVAPMLTISFDLCQEIAQNSGTMNLYGGTVYGNIYTTSNINTKVSARLLGSFYMNGASTITIQDYAGETPEYNIIAPSSRTEGTMIVFKGSGTTPDLSKMNISYDQDKYYLDLEQSGSDWVVSMKHYTKVTVSNLSGTTNEGTVMGTNSGVWQKNCKQGEVITFSRQSSGNFYFWKFWKGTKDDWESSVSYSGDTFTVSGDTYEENFTYGYVAYLYLTSVTDGNVGDGSGGLCTTYKGQTPGANVNNGWAYFGANQAAEGVATPNYGYEFVGFYDTSGNLVTTSTSVTIKFGNSGHHRFQARFKTKAIMLPSTWKTEVASNDYMSSTVTPENLTSIKFASSVPSGYTQIGTLSTGLKVYKGSTINDIAFVAKIVGAPTSCINLFYDMVNLTTIDLSAFDTTNVTSMNSMFESCRKVETITFGSNFNTENVANMADMFANCHGLTGVSLSNFNTAKVTNMAFMFLNCYKLTSLSLSSFNTTNVNNMAYMFSGCKLLTSLDLSSFNTAKVADMQQMFKDCEKITNISLRNFDTSNVKNMAHMFNGCKLLTSLDLSNFNTTNTTNMACMFYCCEALTSLDLSKFNTAKVTDMQQLFYHDYKLTSVNLSSFNTANVTNMNRMFYSCSGLTSLSLSNFNTAKVTDMSYMFYYCTGMKELDLSSFNMASVTNITGMLDFASPGTLAYLKTPYGNSSAITITNGKDLYDMATGSKVSSVPASTTASKTYAVKTVVTYNPNGGTCNTSSVERYYRQSYGTLPSATWPGYIFLGWSRNYFNVDNDIIKYEYCTRSGTTFTMDTGSKNTSENSRAFQVATHLNGNNVSLAFQTWSAGKINFKFTKNSSFNQLLVKLNGNNCDGKFLIDVSKLKDGEYVFQANILSLEVNRMVVKDIMIEQNAGGVATEYTNDVLSSSVTNYNLYNHTLFAKWKVKEDLDFPSTWKSEVADSKYMSTTITPENLTSMKFVSSVPSGYTQIGTLSTGLKVYKGSTINDIAFVSKKIYAPASCAQLFNGLTKLTTMDLSAFDTTKTTNMACMFYRCEALTSLDLSKFNTTKVTDMQQMFYHNYKLTSVNLSSFNTANVTDMNRMFSSCSVLASLSLSNFNTAKVTNMSDMFANCLSLTSLSLSNFNTAKVTIMSYMFVNCYKLTSLSLSSFNTANVTNMAYMLSGCKLLTSLDLSSFNTAKVTSMNSMFENCENVKSITFGSNFSTAKVTTMGRMFLNCPALESLDLSKFNTTNVTTMRQMFDTCKALKTLSLSTFNTTNVTDMCQMFYNCPLLTTITFGSNFNTAKVTDFSYMFHTCSSLTSLNVSNFNTSNATNMLAMFYGCSSLTSLNVSNFVTSKVTNMSNLFMGCAKLTSLSLSNFNTANVTNMYCMFYGCSGLTKLDLTSFNTEKVTDMTTMFYGCTGLTNLNLSSFKMVAVISLSNMLNLGSSNKIVTLNTPYGNTKAIPITTGSTLYDSVTRNVVTSVAQGTASSRLFQNSKPTLYFPGDWETQVKSSNYMTSTITPSALTSITFSLISSAPSGYTQIGTLSNGIKVYRSTSDTTKIIFASDEIIYAKDVDLGSYFVNLKTSIKYLYLNNFNTENDLGFGILFKDFSALEELDLSGLTIDKSAITDYMLYFSSNCKIKKLRTPRTKNSSYTINIGFRAKAGLYLDNGSADIYSSSAYTTELGNTITIGATSKTYYRRAFFPTATTNQQYWLERLSNLGISYSRIVSIYFIKEPASWLSVPYGNLASNIEVYTNTEQTALGLLILADTCYAPKDCNNLFKNLTFTPQNIYFYGNFNTSYTTNMYRMFWASTKLVNIDIGNFDMTKVTNISQMFYNCSSLSDLNLYSWRLSALSSSPSNVFYGCSFDSLSAPTLNSGVTISLPHGMFYPVRVGASTRYMSTSTLSTTTNGLDLTLTNPSISGSFISDLPVQENNEIDIIIQDNKKEKMFYIQKIEG